MSGEKWSAERVNDEVLSRMSPRAVLVARAAAFAAGGEGALDAEALAALLDAAPLRVLEGLQEGIDAGLDLTDAGEGRYRLAPSQAAALRDGTGPSLAAAWRAVLGTPAGDAPEDGARDSEQPHPRRALDAAGAERAAGQLVEAARRSRGYGAAAAAQLEEAGALLAGLPATPARRVLAVRALMETGRLLWVGEGEGYTLAAARARLETARSMLDADAPLAVRVELEALIGWVNYDLGDGDGLRRSLEALEGACAMLETAGQDRAAAELLNDRAAVHIRLGEPAAALALLHGSRAAFSALGDSPVVRIELAETDHLLARLPLSVPAPAGEESEALESALGHALSAALVYADLGMHREQARVKETVGRLQCALGDLEAARNELSEAFHTQRSHQDLLGLARTSGALAEVLGASGAYREALAMLRHSIVLNRDKGAPRGLAYNRRALDALVAATADGALRDEVAELAAELADAEVRWG